MGHGWFADSALAAATTKKGWEHAPLEPVDLNDYLNAENPWAKRLLGLEPFERRGDSALIEREDDHELFGSMLERFGETPERLRELALRGSDDPVYVCMQESIFLSTRRTYHGISRHHMRVTLDRFGDDAPRCELGAGCGSNMIWQDVAEIYGGELTRNGRELGRRLGLEIHPFDFHDEASYDFIRPGSLVYTSHGIEQVPDARTFLEALRARRERVRCVVHFEPLYDAARQSLLGLMRNRYAELNDYNRNLLALISEDPETEILHLDTDVFGTNPLNPSSILVWRFRP